MFLCPDSILDIFDLEEKDRPEQYKYIFRSGLDNDAQVTQVQSLSPVIIVGTIQYVYGIRYLFSLAPDWYLLYQGTFDGNQVLLYEGSCNQAKV